MYSPFLRLFLAGVLFVLSGQYCHAQVRDAFDDASLSDSPVWQGDTASFVQEGDSLRLSAAGAGSAWISTASVAIDSASWTFDCYLGFNPSSSNYVRYYLSSDQSTLGDSLHGYFVMIGNTSDEVSLYRQDGWSTTEIIDGTDGLLSLSSVSLSIQVHRDELGNWTLYADSARTGSFALQGTAFDDIYPKSSYTGLFANFTSTRKDKIWFDNLVVSGSPYRDRQAPQISGWEVLDSNSVCLWFDEAVDLATGPTQAILSPGGNPTSVDNFGDSLCLHWGNPFAQGTWHELILSELSDSSGNLLNDTLNFFYFSPPMVSPGNIRINELLPDPSPAVGLPASEMIELLNASDQLFLLDGWLLSDGSTTAILDSVYLAPGSYLILSPADEAWQWEAHGEVMPLSRWPSLNNGGDELSLYTPDTMLIDRVAYTTDWYQDEDKSAGGYSLERINPWPVCDGASNWTVSLDALGGSPGRVNSVFDTLPDLTAPQLSHLEVLNADSLLLFFDEAIDSTRLPDALVIVSGGDGTLHWQTNQPTQVLFIPDSSLGQEQWHVLSLQGFRDCPGNSSDLDTVQFYLDQQGPVAQYWEVRTESSLLVYFSEPLNAYAAGQEANFLLDSVAPQRARLSSDTSVLLEFATAFAERQHMLHIANQKDTLDNSTSSDSLAWFYRDDIEKTAVLAADLLSITFRRVPVVDTVLLSSYFELADMRPVNWLATEDSLTFLLALEGELPENRDQTLYISGLLAASGQRLICPAQTVHYDTRAPKVVSWEWTRQDSIYLYFSEAVDSISSSNVIHYAFGPEEHFPLEARPQGDSAVVLVLGDTIEQEVDYTLVVSGIADLAGNTMSNQRLTLRFDLLPPAISQVAIWQDTTLRITFSEAVTLSDSAFCLVEGDTIRSITQNPYATEWLLLHSGSGFRRISPLLLQCFSITDTRGNMADSLEAFLNHDLPLLADARFYDQQTVELLWSVPMDTSSSSWRWDSSGTQALVLLNRELNDGDSLHLALAPLTDALGNSWPGDTIRIQYEAGLSSMEILNSYTLEGTFVDVPEEKFYTASQFSLSPFIPIAQVLKDENSPGKLRVVLGSPLAVNTSYSLSYRPGLYRNGTRLSGGSHPFLIDRMPPHVSKAALLSDSQISLAFDEPMDSKSLLVSGNYQMSNRAIRLVEVISPDSCIVAFQPELADGDSLDVHVSGPVDISQNRMADTTLSFVYLAHPEAARGEIIFTECMPDPDGARGLTNQEYVEIFNRSDQDYLLKGYLIADPGSSASLPEFMLKAGHYLAIQSSGGSGTLPDTDSVLFVEKLPSLNNGGDLLALISPTGDTIDIVAYENTWHDAEGSKSGISLERINPFEETCFSHMNWRSSTASLGGSPGGRNSVFDSLPDSQAPLVTDWSTNHTDSIWLSFPEPMDTSSVGQISNNGLGVEVSSIWHNDHNQQLLLVLTNPLPAGQLNTLLLSGWQDCSGNEMLPLTITSGRGRSPEVHELVINEIMAVSHEEARYPTEYVELYNRSGALLNLQDVMFADSRDTLVLPEFLLPADSFVVLHPSTSAGVFDQEVLHINLSNWPSLNNSGETLRLFNQQKQELHRVSYLPDWYGDTESAGIALEQIDAEKPCHEEDNWKPGTHPKGGTPGRANSVLERRPDRKGPQLLDLLLTDSLLLLQFDEKINHQNHALLSVTVAGTVWPEWQFDQTPFPDKIWLAIDERLPADRAYDIAVSGLYDCAGNRILEEEGVASFIIPVSGDSGDILLSEILFNPYPDGTDFVEVYNQSEHYIALGDWHLQSQKDSLSNETISKHELIIAPYSYLVFTESPTALTANHSQVPERVIIETDLPSLPDDDGSIWLIDGAGNVVEGMNYSEDQHHPLLHDVEGISLERIRFDVPASVVNNWASASRSANFATPGLINSQQKEPAPVSEQFLVSPSVLHYGMPLAEEFFTINYQLDQSGWVGNLTVYSMEGTVIAELAKQYLLGDSGFFTWAGTDTQGGKVPTGYYLLFIDLWNNGGEKLQFRKTLVVGK